MGYIDGKINIALLGWGAPKTAASAHAHSRFNTSGPDPLGFDWEGLAASRGTAGVIVAVPSFNSLGIDSVMVNDKVDKIHTQVRELDHRMCSFENSWVQFSSFMDAGREWPLYPGLVCVIL